MTRTTRHTQAGFGLLEATLVIAMLAVVSAVAFTAILSAQRKGAVPQVTAQMQNSESMLRGLALSGLRLPMPEGAEASPGRPGYLEGWLPGSSGTSAVTQTRYVVNAALVTPPPALYQADAGNLLDGKIHPRAATNGLDFCLALVSEERSGKSLPDSRRMAFGLQTALSDGSVRPPEFLPGGDTLVETRMVGYTELAADLGCYKAMSALSASVKEAAVYLEALRLAEEGVTIRALNVRSSEQAVDLLHMRMAIWSTGLATATMNIVLANAQLKIHAVIGAVTAAMQITRNLLTIATMAMYVVDTNERLTAATEGLAKNRDRLSRAEAYRDTLQQELDERVAGIHAAQERGLR